MARVLIFSFGLLSHNVKLMPWRTTLEVTAGLRDLGHDVDLISLVDADALRLNNDCPQVVTAPKTTVQEILATLKESLRYDDYDVIFFPVSISGNRLIKRLIVNFRGTRIAYLPGSVFEFKNIMSITGKLPWRKVLPYLYQSIFPRFLFERSLVDMKCTTIITNSDYSQRRLKFRRDIKKITIPPGRENPSALQMEDGQTKTWGSPQLSYFLFVGPPLDIRGIKVLLDAYSRIADDPSVPDLVCLFRSDAHLDIPQIRKAFEEDFGHVKVRFVWESVSKADLEMHIKQSVAVVMPFLLVPSEIPLAVYEAAGFGTYVVTTGPNGTSEFVDQFGCSVRPGNALELADALLRLSQSNSRNYNDDARKAFEKLPTWEEVALQWNFLVEEACQEQGYGTNV